MDILIENGDISVGSSGLPDMIMGDDEIIQKIKIALKAVKGSFIYDRNLGAFDKDYIPSAANLSEIEMLINECFVNSILSVNANSVERAGDGLRLGLTVFDGYKAFETEVNLNG